MPSCQSLIKESKWNISIESAFIGGRNPFSTAISIAIYEAAPRLHKQIPRCTLPIQARLAEIRQGRFLKTCQLITAALRYLCLSTHILAFQLMSHCGLFVFLLFEEQSQCKAHISHWSGPMQPRRACRTALMEKPWTELLRNLSPKTLGNLTFVFQLSAFSLPAPFPQKKRCCQKDEEKNQHATSTFGILRKQADAFV